MKEPKSQPHHLSAPLRYFVTAVCTMLITCTTLFAQKVGGADSYDEHNSTTRRVLVHYVPDAQGFFQKSSLQSVDRVEGIVETYAYNKRLGAIYVLTEVGNYEVKLEGTQQRLMRRERTIPHLSGKELDNAIAARNIQLMALIDQRNTAHKQAREEAFQLRQQFIVDSLRAAQDSLEQVRWTATQQARAEKRRAQYRENHPWNLLPIKDFRLFCLDAGCNSESRTKVVSILGMSGDTLFYSSMEQLPLDFQYEKVHKAILPKSLQDDADYRYHWDIFGDSLRAHHYSSQQQVNTNTDAYLTALRQLKDYAPYGYISNWSWLSGEHLAFHFTYTNLNDRTLRDVDVFWTLSTASGEARTSGHFKGSGQLQSGTSQSWDWDTSPYSAPTDATRMTLTKIVLTFADGKQQVIPQHAIHFEQ